MRENGQGKVKRAILATVYVGILVPGSVHNSGIPYAL